MIRFRKALLTAASALFLLVALASAACAAAPGLGVWQESETGAAAIAGTWTWDASRQAFVAGWKNGAAAVIRVERLDDQVVLARTDAASSSSAGLTARYVGKRTGNTLAGTVDWTMRGQTWRGTWRADLVVNYKALAGSPTEPMTPQQAADVFAWLAAETDVAFRYPVDGCYARAYLMTRRLEGLGARPQKAWAFANGDSLHVNTAYAPEGFVEWGYHVAPVVRVRYAKGDWDMVLDPSLFDGPVTAADWGAGMKKTPASKPFVEVTPIGTPPVFPDGHRAPGSGYTPGVDPPNIDAAARAKMAEYKPKERRYR